jgi:hypothetical protein
LNGKVVDARDLTFLRSGGVYERKRTPPLEEPMPTDSKRAATLDSAVALSGFLGLLVAERQEREGGGPYRAEPILARAGLSDDQIAVITGHDASRVRAIIDSDATVPRPARQQSVIDRARAALLTHRASTS